MGQTLSTVCVCVIGARRNTGILVKVEIIGALTTCAVGGISGASYALGTTTRAIIKERGFRKLSTRA